MVLSTPAFAAADEEGWDGPKLKPVPREEVYEFAKKPTVTKARRDAYEIYFASKGKCDVAVAIEDSKGWIVRHLVYGVLGQNAPQPLQKDSLEQTLTWDGKDDQGEYHDSPEKCTVRVSLGLHPTLDKVLGYHPKDLVAGGIILSIGADADGVYVLELCSSNQLRMFDHDGKYLRTLIPYHADKVNTSQLNILYRKTENGRTVPQLSGIGGTEPFVHVEDNQCMAVAGGKIAVSTGGIHYPHYLLRYRTDGTTGGEPVHGALICKTFPTNGVSEPHLAISPDGKWIYFTGLDNVGGKPGMYYWNAVWRIPWDRDSKNPIFDRDPHIGEKPFIGILTGGAVSSVGKDNDQFYTPRGLTCDAQGRLYVCDSLNDRIQVFSPDGKYLKTIPVKTPQEIGVHHKTGEIYVLSYLREQHGSGRSGFLRGELAQLKLGSMDNPKPLIEHKIATPPVQGGQGFFTPVFCLDSWASPARIWMITGQQRLQIFTEKGNSFELHGDFQQEFVGAGLRPGMLGQGTRCRLAVDPIRHHLYYLQGSRLIRCDPGGPGKFEPVQHYVAAEEMDFGRDGLFCLRALRYLARFDLEKIVPNAQREGLLIPFDAEVPFDYGEQQAAQRQARKLRGVILIPALPGAAKDVVAVVKPEGYGPTYEETYEGYRPPFATDDRTLAAWKQRPHETPDWPKYSLQKYKAKKHYSPLDFAYVAFRHEATSYGSPALMELGNAALDAGSFELARYYFERIKNYHRFTAVDRGALDLGLLQCYQRLGDAAFSQRASPDAVSLSDYTLLEPLVPDLSHYRNTWTVRRELGYRFWMPHNEVVPSVCGSNLVYKDKNIVYCRSLLTGALKWLYDEGGLVWDFEKIMGGHGYYLCYPYQDLVAHDGMVYTFVVKQGPSLVALDLTTGEKQWAAGPMAASSRAELDDRYAARPAVGGGRVYATVVHDDIEGESHLSSTVAVAAFEARSGKLLWRRPLCRVTRSKFTISCSACTCARRRPPWKPATSRKSRSTSTGWPPARPPRTRRCGPC